MTCYKVSNIPKEILVSLFKIILELDFYHYPITEPEVANDPTELLDSCICIIFWIMHLLALADILGITCVGTMFGYAMLRGMVFCSNPTLAWILGCGELCEQNIFFYRLICQLTDSWYVSTCTCILLVVNRVAELMNGSRIFQVIS